MVSLFFMILLGVFHFDDCNGEEKFDGKPISPTIINATGEYYIIRNKSSSTIDFSNSSISCNYYNSNKRSNPHNCYVICSKIGGCKHSHIYCNNSPSCSISCNDAFLCLNSVILASPNVTKQNNNSNSHGSDVKLVCNGALSCVNLNTTFNNINGIIECGGFESCGNGKLNSYFSNTSIVCSYNYSCMLMDVSFFNNDNVSLLCSSPIFDTLSGVSIAIPPPCHRMKFNSHNSSNVGITTGFELDNSDIFVENCSYFKLFTIHTIGKVGGSNIFHFVDVNDIVLDCFPTVSCFESTFMVISSKDNNNSGSDVTWWCGYREGVSHDEFPINPCDGSQLFAKNANKLDIKLYSSGDGMDISITGPSYYINSVNNETVIRSSVECMYYGCSNIEFHSDNGIADWDIYYYFPQCDVYPYCSNISSCVSSWDFWCDNDAGYGSFEPSQTKSFRMY